MENQEKREKMLAKVLNYNDNMKNFIRAKYPDLMIDADEIINQTWIAIHELDAKKLAAVEIPEKYAIQMTYNTLYRMMRKEKTESAKKQVPTKILPDKPVEIQGFMELSDKTEVAIRPNINEILGANLEQDTALKYKNSYLKRTNALKTLQINNDVSYDEKRAYILFRAGHSARKIAQKMGVTPEYIRDTVKKLKPKIKQETVKPKRCINNMINSDKSIVMENLPNISNYLHVIDQGLAVVFDAYFIDGKKQSAIAKGLKVSQKTISLKIKKINQLLKKSDIKAYLKPSNFKRYVKPNCKIASQSEKDLKTFDAKEREIKSKLVPISKVKLQPVLEAKKSFYMKRQPLEDQPIEISEKQLIAYLKTYDSDLQSLDFWLSDQKSKIKKPDTISYLPKTANGCYKIA